MHLVNELLCDGHAQTRALVVGAARALLLRERLKNMLQEFLAHTDAVVLDLHPQVDKTFFKQRFLGAEVDLAAVGRVLDGVGKNVDEHLPDMQLTADQVRVPERADLLCEGHVPVHDLALHDGAAGIQQRPQIKRRVQHLHIAGFDFGHVQHVVDEGEQVGRRTAHLGHAVPHAGLVVKVVLGNVQHTHNAVDGRADVVGHVGQELRLGDAGLLGLAQGFFGLGAEPLGADDQCDADRGNQNAQAGQHDNGRVLIGQPRQRERLLPQVDVGVGDGADLGAGQAVDALVQHAAQQHIVVLPDADAEIALLVAQHRAQLVARVVKDRALGLVGVGIVGIDGPGVHGSQAVIKGIQVFYMSRVAQAGHFQRGGGKIVCDSDIVQRAVVAAQQHPGKLRRQIAVGQLVAVVLRLGQVVGQVDDKIRLPVRQHGLVLAAVRGLQEFVTQPRPAYCLLENIHHDAGGHAVRRHVGVRVAVRVDKHREHRVCVVAGDDIVYLGVGQVNFAAGMSAGVVFVEQGRAPAGVVAVDFADGIVDKLLGDGVILAHGYVNALLVEGINDPFVLRLAQPVGGCGGDLPVAQCTGQLLVGVIVHRGVAETVLLGVGSKALIAAIAAAAHADSYAVEGVVVAGHNAAVAGFDGQHRRHCADGLGGKGKLLVVLRGPSQHRDQVDLPGGQLLHGLLGVAVQAGVCKGYVLMLGNVLQQLIGVAAAAAVCSGGHVAGVGVEADAQGAQGGPATVRGVHGHGKAEQNADSQAEQQQHGCPASACAGILLLIHRKQLRSF